MLNPFAEVYIPKNCKSKDSETEKDTRFYEQKVKTQNVPRDEKQYQATTTNISNRDRNTINTDDQKQGITTNTVLKAMKEKDKEDVGQKIAINDNTKSKPYHQTVNQDTKKKDFGWNVVVIASNRKP